MTTSQDPIEERLTRALHQAAAQLPVPDADVSVFRQRLAQARAATPRGHIAPAHFRALWPVAAGLGAVLAAIAFAGGFSGAQPARSRHGGAAVAGLASVPAAVRASFVSLRRPRQADDALPADASQRWLSRLPAGTLPNESRLVLSAPTYDVWLVPGTTEECMHTWFTGLDSPGTSGVGTGGCISPADADAVGIFSDGVAWGARNGTPPPAGYTSLFAGILPARATGVTITLKDGTTQTLNADSQGAVAQPFLASDPITAASVIGPDGSSTPIRSIAFGFNAGLPPQRR
jgi:hypothetical protein